MSEQVTCHEWKERTKMNGTTEMAWFCFVEGQPWGWILNLNGVVYCPICGTRLNADGTTTEMVAKEVARLCAVQAALCREERCDICELAPCGDMPSEIDEFSEIVLAANQPKTTIPDCGICTHTCTDAGKPHNQRSLPAEECQIAQEQER